MNCFVDSFNFGSHFRFRFEAGLHYVFCGFDIFVGSVCADCLFANFGNNAVVILVYMVYLADVAKGAI